MIRANSVFPGYRSGRLTAVECIGRRGGMWRCACDCGRPMNVSRSHLLHFNVRSCGCLKLEAIIATGHRNARHGMRYTPTWKTWSSIKERCLNPKHKNYPRYGGRGITICQSWAESFEAFFADMGERPVGMSIDRINNDRGYEPGNCRWATASQQCRNRSSNVLLTAFGETKTIADWAEDARCVVPAEVLSRRIVSGWNPSDALLRPRRRQRNNTPFDHVSGRTVRLVAVV